MRPCASLNILEYPIPEHTNVNLVCIVPGIGCSSATNIIGDKKKNVSYFLLHILSLNRHYVKDMVSPVAMASFNDR